MPPRGKVGNILHSHFKSAVVDTCSLEDSIREVSVRGGHTRIARIGTQGIWLECRLPQMLGGFNFGRNAVTDLDFMPVALHKPMSSCARSSVVHSVDISVLAAYTIGKSVPTICIHTLLQCEYVCVCIRNIIHCIIVFIKT